MDNLALLLLLPKQSNPIITELGVEKQCICCKEYYPATKEFFYGRGYTYKNGISSLEGNCKDCYKQKFKPHTVGTYDVSHRYQKEK